MALPDGPEKDFAMINYGPWDRMDDNSPFIEGYGAKPAGACFYPEDMTAEEFDALADSAQDSLLKEQRRMAFPVSFIHIPCIFRGTSDRRVRAVPRWRMV